MKKQRPKLKISTIQIITKMATTLKYYSLMCLAFGLMHMNQAIGQNSDAMKNSQTTNAILKIYTQDEADVKATVEQFLIVAGNYNLDAMVKMMSDNANLATIRLRDGKWTTETMLMSEYFEAAKNRTNRPYFEPVKEYTIHLSDGHLAFVKADAVLHAFGVPLLHNIDYFTLIKENEA